MINRSVRPLALMAATLRRLPIAQRWLGACEGQARSAAYCYGVWLRHLTLIQTHAAEPAPLHNIAELGPGPSLGTLLAALLSGAEQAIALDVARHANSVELNRRHISELTALFRKNAPIPLTDDKGDAIRPLLDNYAFPSKALHMTSAIRTLDERSAMLEAMLEGHTSGLRYLAPWSDASVIEAGTLDLIFSQAVMEHVEDLASTYAICRRWLRPGGLMSHQIDFRSHGTARHWNGHYTLSDSIWQYMARARPYLLNREPPSTHIRLIEKNGFEIVAALPTQEPSVIGVDDLAPRFQHIKNNDLRTSGMYILARRVR